MLLQHFKLRRQWNSATFCRMRGGQLKAERRRDLAHGRFGRICTVTFCDITIYVDAVSIQIHPWELMLRTGNDRFAHGLELNAMHPQHANFVFPWVTSSLFRRQTRGGYPHQSTSSPCIVIHPFLMIIHYCLDIALQFSQSFVFDYLLISDIWKFDHDNESYRLSYRQVSIE